MKNRKSYPWHLIIGVAVIVIAASIIAILSSPGSREKSDVVVPENEATTPLARPATGIEPSRSVSTTLETSEPGSPTVAEQQTPVPSEEARMNVEDQPRKFFVMEFNNMSELPEGYEMENMQLTDRGIELEPPEPGEEDKPRFGVLKSPPQEMDFYSNALSPLWREELPEGTSMLVEVSLSPDGENWGIWHQVMVDDDSAGQVKEYYPDGSPNPNYGYTPGGVLCWGYRQWAQFKYRITLYSEVQESPLLSGFRIFYQDTTLGKGHLAEVVSD